jgi:hypothetical protein
MSLRMQVQLSQEAVMRKLSSVTIQIGPVTFTDCAI